jgi:hypothetical protein
VRYFLLVQIQQSVPHLCQLRNGCGKWYISGTSCEDTHKSLAVLVRIVVVTPDEGVQVTLFPGGDESQPLASLVLLAKHTEKFDDVWMVQLTPR